MQSEDGPRPRAAYAVGLWLASRLLVAIVLWVSLPQPGLRAFLGVLAYRWDAGNYLKLVTHGYPNVLPGAHPEAVLWAFFPLYPWLVRGLSLATHAHFVHVALAVNLILGPVVAWLLYHWLRRRLDDRQALYGVALFSFWPQSYFHSYAYTEPLYLLLLLSLLLLIDHPPQPRPDAAPPLLTAPRLLAVAALGVLLGLSRPTALICGGMIGISWLISAWRQGLPGSLFRREALAAVLMGAGIIAANAWFSYGHCLQQTGVLTNCHWQAEVAGWGFGGTFLPQAFLDDVFRIVQPPAGTRHMHLFRFVRIWELSALLLCVPCVVLLARRAPRWGWLPALTMAVPILSEMSVWTIRSVPRFLSATPALFLLCGTLSGRRAGLVLLGAAILLHVISHHATAIGVWQSF
jgi:hypothetical protein